MDNPPQISIQGFGLQTCDLSRKHVQVSKSHIGCIFSRFLSFANHMPELAFLLVQG